ncbi:hypothetical protein NBRC106471_2844 [Acetobacter pasteurianus subsp. pasteurianus LMG 1262 = NBRC 106471]|nr:hypothetical protein NBRC106471_2844 [Acetobacter pasteurianus subsp. pasteurianus LMG 1262 = NBRC 106471]
MPLNVSVAPDFATVSFDTLGIEPIGTSMAMPFTLYGMQTLFALILASFSTSRPTGGIPRASIELFVRTISQHPALPPILSSGWYINVLVPDASPVETRLTLTQSFPRTPASMSSNVPTDRMPEMLPCVVRPVRTDCAISGISLISSGWLSVSLTASEMGWLPSSPHGIAMCQNGRWKKRLRERTADEGYSDRR